MMEGIPSIIRPLVIFLVGISSNFIARSLPSAAPEGSSHGANERTNQKILAVVASGFSRLLYYFFGISVFVFILVSLRILQPSGLADGGSLDCSGDDDFLFFGLPFWASILGFPLGFRSRQNKQGVCDIFPQGDRLPCPLIFRLFRGD